MTSASISNPTTSPLADNRWAINSLTTEQLAELIGHLVAHCDKLEQPNMAFLLSLAEEEARHVAGLPELQPPSIFEGNTPPTLSL